MLGTMGDDATANFWVDGANEARRDIVNESVNVWKPSAFTAKSRDDIGDSNVDALFSNVELGKGEETFLVIRNGREKVGVMTVDVAQSVKPSIDIGNVSTHKLLLGGSVNSPAIGMAAHQNMRTSQYTCTKLQYSLE